MFGSIIQADMQISGKILIYKKKNRYFSLTQEALLDMLEFSSRCANIQKESFNDKQIPISKILIPKS